MAGGGAVTPLSSRTLDRSYVSAGDDLHPLGAGRELTTLDVAMQHADGRAGRRGELSRERLGDGDRAVPAPGAADRDGQVALSLALVPRQDVLEEVAACGARTPAVSGAART